MAPGIEDRFRYLFDSPQDRAGFDGWLARAAASDDPMFYAVIDSASQRCDGRQALMRITPEHGVIEVGNILWGPAIARSRVATNPCFCSPGAFEDLGYRRFEWKCDAHATNPRCARLVVCFRYEGTFRQTHERAEPRYGLVCYRDIDWPSIRSTLLRNGAPTNFDDQAEQKLDLRNCGSVINANRPRSHALSGDKTAKPLKRMRRAQWALFFP